MNKKPPITLRWILVLLLVLACVFYFVPWSTPFDLTLNATEFDSDGNEIGTTQIRIHGEWLIYLFQKDRLDIEIDPFDGWSTFGLSTDEPTNKKGVIYTPTDNLMEVALYAAEGANSAFVELYFTYSFDNFVLYFNSAEGRTTYLASVGDDHTADKVIDHFMALNFNILPNRQG